MPESDRRPTHQLSFEIGEPRSTLGGFNRSRLRFARELRQMRQVRLAELTGVNTSAISHFETGRHSPLPTTVASLARALSVPPEFLTNEDELTASMATGYFRADRKTAEPVKASVSRWLSLQSMAFEVLDSHGLLSEPFVPTIPVSSDHTPVDPEDIAEEVRRMMGVPIGPIANAIDLVESFGVLVVRVQLPLESMDSFSIPCQPRPIIALGSSRSHSGRSRFDVCHELGHLVMHRNAVAGHRVMESQANTFASAFLMPRVEMERQLPSQVDIKTFTTIASEWGVSTEALIYRAHTLGLATKESYLSARRFLRKSMLGNDPQRDEHPRTAQLVAAFADEPGAISRVASKIHLFENDVVRLVHRDRSEGLEVFDLLIAA